MSCVIKRYQTNLKGKFYRIVVGPTMLYEVKVLAGQEFSHLEYESCRNENVVMDVQGYYEGYG